MNLANKLTLFRIFLVIIIVIVAYVPINGTILNIGIDMWILNIIFIIASITDKLDGNIARKRNQITEFGKFLDPIADKMLVLSAMLILVERKLLPAWIPIIILIRGSLLFNILNSLYVSFDNSTFNCSASLYRYFIIIYFIPEYFNIKIYILLKKFNITYNYVRN